MTSYIPNFLTKLKHEPPKSPFNTPMKPLPRTYGVESQKRNKLDDSPPLSTEKAKYIQHVVGSLLCNARAIDMTILHALSNIASTQSNPTQKTLQASVSYVLNPRCQDAEFLTSNVESTQTLRSGTGFSGSELISRS